MNYRREIDGLRAIAVLPVIAFHAGLPPFSGGFIGVDVFFVISGYLITSIILLERDAGTFSLAGFYERRARRILPALFVVMAACLLPAWLWLLPADLRNFSESLAAVAAFCSNFLFWHEAGYFDSASELKPLLHTWSLAVEEQYYVVFPLLMLLLSRRGTRTTATALAAIGVASLVLAEHAVANAPATAFFLLPARAWELLAGALVALHLAGRVNTDTPAILRESGGITGLLLLLYALCAFDSQTPFPGLHAAVPVAGTALLILCADRTTLAGRLLATQWLVGIGLVSYSAYLWHQPLLAFARHYAGGEPAAGIRAGLALASFPLAWLTWRFVETPWRNRRRFSRRQVVLAALCFTLLFGALGIAGHLLDGYAARFPAFIARMEQAKNDGNPLRQRCHAERGFFSTPDDGCILGDARRVVGALLGDSHADALAHETGIALARHGVGIRQFSYSSCPPVTGIDRREYPQCGAYNDGVLAYVAATPDLQWLVLSARWAIFLERHRYDNGEGGIESGDDSRADPVVDGKVMRDLDEEERFRLVADRYVASVQRLLALGRHVILVYPVPEAGWKVPDRLGRLYLHSGQVVATDASTSHARFLARNARALAVLDRIGEHPRLHRVYPEKQLCNTQLPGRCQTHREGTPLYYDDDHLANAGARPLAEEIAAIIAGAAR